MSTVHDGFATIRRPRVGVPRHPPRPPSLASVPENGIGWRHGNDHQNRASFWAEKGSISPLTNGSDTSDKFNYGCLGDRCKLSPVGDPSVPWWELATRKSRYRSCPALEMHVSNSVLFFLIRFYLVYLYDSYHIILSFPLLPRTLKHTGMQLFTFVVEAT
nr:unnamed protein product [Callosobruchus chinensis]